jgi:hypothetical protein
MDVLDILARIGGICMTFKNLNKINYLTSKAVVLFLFLGSIRGSENLPKYGEVIPPPKGCISMVFIDPKDDSYCKRSKEGQIDIIVVIGREETINRPPYSPNDFEKLIGKNSSKDADFSNGIPGIAAWRYVKKYLMPTDEVSTFGFFDAGFIVIRNNKIFCLVTTAHNF